MRRAGVVVVAMITATLAAIAGPGASPAYACSCAVMSEREYAVAADLVVRAVVTDLREPFLAMRSDAPVRVRLAVERVDKGEAGDQITLTTARSGASCGFSFERGHRYLIYARDGETGLCSGNRYLGAAPEVPLGRDRWPTATVLMAVAAVVAGAAVGGWLLVHRRRARPG